GNRWYKPIPNNTAYDKTGIASWYGRDFHGKHSANGEVYDMNALSAAHKTLPLPTLVRVTNLENGRSAIVRINDRGPFVKERLIDLSYAAAKQLGYADRGTAHVRVQTLDMPAPQQAVMLASAPRQKTVPASASAGKMFIQLGAFSSKDNALRLQDKLKADFSNTRSAAIQLAGKVLYRVRLGPFDDMTKIEQTVLILQRKGFRKPMVIIE
ncbi:MAG: septal ring lytic transglycosylase RlpA family protein, partial [Mariprofundus sp.]|nr:septal ring lytic transglycosylase RlpA family protein [Mariprofundus sp.]